MVARIDQSQLTAIADLAQRLGTPPERLTGLWASGLLPALFDQNVRIRSWRAVQAIRSELGLPPDPLLGAVITVDYGLPMTGQLHRIGSSPGILGITPGSQSSSGRTSARQFRVECLQAGTELSHKSALQFLGSRGLKPAGLEEIVQLIITKGPDLEQRNICLIGLLPYPGCRGSQNLFSAHFQDGKMKLEFINPGTFGNYVSFVGLGDP